MSLAPVQLIAIEVGDAARDRLRLRRLLRGLNGRGSIRVLDSWMATRARDGRIRPLDASAADAPGTEGNVIRALVSRAAPGLFDGPRAAGPPLAEHTYGVTTTDLAAIVANLPYDCVILLLLIEHVWALRFSAALRAGGGRMLAHGFLTEPVLQRFAIEVAAIAEAEAAIDLARMVQGAALIDALAAVLDDPRASRTEQHTASVAVAAIAALIVAGQVAEAEAAETVATLVRAGLISVETLDAASRLAAEEAGKTQAAIAAIESLVYNS